MDLLTLLKSINEIGNS